MKPILMVLDDDSQKRADLLKHLRIAGYEVKCAATLEDANKYIRSEHIDYAIIDLKIDYSSQYSGIKAIENINKIQPSAKVIILSAYSKDSVQDEIDRVQIYDYISKKESSNYISATINALEKLKNKHLEKKCFVIMPFSGTTSCSEDEWYDIFQNMIKPSVEESGFNYKCIRAEILIGNIIKHILDNLNRADVVIGDLTDRNPNVFYEIGVRHALRDKTILITQRIDDIPFDLRQYSVIEYSWKTKNGKDDFKKKMHRVLTAIEKDTDGKITSSPIREYLSLNETS